MSGWPLTARKHELEEILAGRYEPPATVERRRPPVAARDDDLQRRGPLGDRVPLRELEELLPDPFGLVLGAHEELVDADGRARLLEGDVARGGSLELRNEDGLPRQHGERALVRAPVHARQAEEERLVGGAERSDLGLAVRHADPRVPSPGRPPPAPPGRALRAPGRGRAA